MRNGRRSWLPALAIVGAGLAILLAAPREAGARDNPAATPFDRLKALAGEWEGTVQTKDGPRATVVYRVTSGGSAVMESLFPGTDHEMVTMYHLDGAELTLTHYCAMGNQPRMRLDQASSAPDELRFVFSGGTNVKPERDAHMHSGRLVFLGADHIESEWAVWQDGRQTGSNKFFLARKKR